MHELLISDNGSRGVIVFHGSLTIQNAVSIKECLLDALEKVTDLSIDHNDATGYDITYIQLLITLRNSAAILGKSISINSSKSFIAFVKDSGLANYKFLLNNEVDI